MNLSSHSKQEQAHGTLQLAIAANHTRAVSALLQDEANDMDADQTSSTIGSDEASKTVIDTEAHIRSRQELRDRLLNVLRTRKGSVEELVEAERQLAAVNEEIDQAKSFLKETKGRVAFSRMDIDYTPSSTAAASFFTPIVSAFGSLGSVLGYVIAALMLIGAAIAPIAAIVWAGRAISRRFTIATDET